MARFDSLGPLSRAAVANTPLDIDLELLIQAYKRARPAGRTELVDPDDPRTWPKVKTPGEADADFARFIEEAIRRKVPGYKPLEVKRNR